MNKVAMAGCSVRPLNFIGLKIQTLPSKMPSVDEAFT